MRSTLLALFFAASINAAEADPAKLLDELRAEFKVLKAEKEEKAKKAGKELPPSLDTYPSVPDLPSPGDDRYLAAVTNLEIIRQAGYSEKTTQIVTEILKELKEQAARRSKELKGKIDATLTTALRQGLDATKAEDLDAPLKAVLDMQREAGNQRINSEHQGINLEGLRGLEQILTAIQDAFLAATATSGKAARDSSPPGEKIRYAGPTNSKALMDVIPRSELLRKLQALADRVNQSAQPKTVDEGKTSASKSETKPAKPKPPTQMEVEKQLRAWAEEVRKPEDIAGLIAKVETFFGQRGGQDSYGIPVQLSQLYHYRRIYEDFKAGTASFQAFAYASPGQGSESVNNIRNLLIKYAVKQVLSGPSGVDPGTDETVAAYLQRVIEKARTAADWPVLLKAVEATSSLGLSTVASSSDSLALRYFVSAQDYEKAQLFAKAASAYSSAFKPGSTILPAEAVAQKLDALKKAHPDEFEKGVQNEEASSSRAVPSSSGSRFELPKNGRR